MAGDRRTKEEAEQGPELKAMLPPHKGGDGLNYDYNRAKGAAVALFNPLPGTFKLLNFPEPQFPNLQNGGQTPALLGLFRRRG